MCLYTTLSPATSSRADLVISSSAFRLKHLVLEGKLYILSILQYSLFLPRLIGPPLLPLSPALAAVCLALPPLPQALCCEDGGED